MAGQADDGASFVFVLDQLSLLKSSPPRLTSRRRRGRYAAIESQQKTSAWFANNNQPLWLILSLFQICSLLFESRQVN